MQVTVNQYVVSQWFIGLIQFSNFIQFSQTKLSCHDLVLTINLTWELLLTLGILVKCISGSIFDIILYFSISHRHFSNLY